MSIGPQRQAPSAGFSLWPCESCMPDDSCVAVEVPLSLPITASAFHRTSLYSCWLVAGELCCDMVTRSWNHLSRRRNAFHLLVSGPTSAHLCRQFPFLPSFSAISSELSVVFVWLPQNGNPSECVQQWVFKCLGELQGEFRCLRTKAEARMQLGFALLAQRTWNLVSVELKDESNFVTLSPLAMLIIVKNSNGFVSAGIFTGVSEFSWIFSQCKYPATGCQKWG